MIEREKLPVRIILFITMMAAFVFGYLDHCFQMNFERLHIFLFNLTSGGFTIIYLTEGRGKPSIKACTFFILSILFALLSFFKLYIPAAITGILIAILVESYRQKHFSFLPVIFFKIKEPTSVKFHHASLLCLVIGLLMSSFVILNESCFKLFHLEKLTLDVFFLGFSFPVSLITMSIIFSLIEGSKNDLLPAIEHLFFWSICGGVIVFFIFILMKSFIGEVVISTFLFTTVLSIFVVFMKFGRHLQQKYFLISGIYFLMATAVTGIIYILMKRPDYNELTGKIILRMHAFYSLYGWNLTGMMVIIRWNDFPITLNTRYAIFFHWGVILILAPLAKFFKPLAIPAVISYVLFLSVFFIKGLNISNAST